MVTMPIDHAKSFSALIYQSEKIQENVSCGEFLLGLKLFEASTGNGVTKMEVMVSIFGLRLIKHRNIASFSFTIK